MPRRAQETKFLQLLFQDHYRANPENIDLPSEVHAREFGMESWAYTWRCIERNERDESGSTIRKGCGRSGNSFIRISKCPNCGSSDIHVNNWTRHHGYRTGEALVKELARSAPHSVYHSAAFYKIPVARHMDEKEWQGAELVFDIDADHLNSPCADEHDTWRCNNPECGETGSGRSPKTGCPKCKGMSFSSRKWICDKCLDDAKKTLLKVYDEFLVSDLGINPELIQLNYSGHRGYHIRVRDPRVYKLDSKARIEIVHFITGMGFDSTKAVVTDGSIPRVSPQSFPGWAGKTADAMVEFIRNIDTYLGTEQWVKRLKKNRTAAIKGLQREPPIITTVPGIGVKSWQEIAAKSTIAFGGEIDVPVTHDIHRVIRLIGSLNGKTGFLVSELTRDETDDFDPFGDALAFGEGALKLRVAGGQVKVPKFRVGDDVYGPYGDEVVEFPMPAAVFLLCKGVATIE